MIWQTIFNIPPQGISIYDQRVWKSHLIELVNESTCNCIIILLYVDVNGVIYYFIIILYYFIDVIK